MKSEIRQAVASMGIEELDEVIAESCDRQNRLLLIEGERLKRLGTVNDEMLAARGKGDQAAVAKVHGQGLGCSVKPTGAGEKKKAGGSRGDGKAIRERIVGVLREMGGLVAPGVLAEKVGISGTALAYHIKQLVPEFVHSEGSTSNRRYGVVRQGE